MMQISSGSVSQCALAKKCHAYLYGRHVIIQNDCKPLEMIKQKTIHAAQCQLQCMLLHIQKYDYTIQYKPGKEMVLADHLSCFPSHKESLPIPIQHVHVSTSELDAIWGAIEHDLVYSTVYHLNLREWPNNLKQVLRIAWHFRGAWDELSIEAHILLMGSWVCVPQKTPWPHPCWSSQSPSQDGELQAQVKEVVYWPSIDASLLTIFAGVPYAQGIRPLHWHSQYFPKTSLMTHGRRLQQTSSTTKAKSTSLPVMCSASTPSYPKFPPNQPILCPKSYKNSSLSTDHPASSTLTMALPSHPKSLPSSCSDSTLTI